MANWKIGELAKRTGLTVRTLHHYDAIGLLRPSGRSAAGYRLYGEEDVVRLHRIVALRQLGFPLEEVRALLRDPRYTAGRLLALQMERLRAQMREAGELLGRLEGIARRLDAAQGEAAPAPAEEFLNIVEMTVMFEKHYTPEQRATLDQRARELGPEGMAAVEQEWPALVARVRDCMARGVEPRGEEMRPLAERWKELIRMFTGGNPAITASLEQVYRSEPSAWQRSGLDPAIMAYVGRAMETAAGE